MTTNISVSITDTAESPDAETTGSLKDTTRRILIPVDSSEHSERAFNWYLENIKRAGDGLYLTHIVDPMPAGINYAVANKSSSVKQDFSRSLNKQAEAGRVIRSKYLTQCDSIGLPASFTIYAGTKPGELIVRLAHEHKANIVIIGNRGIGTVKRTFLGSVSDYIVHNMCIPVCIVPPSKSMKKK